ncbi:N(4)-(beta-N-acetylglucosaminyl)-L-asparaginase [Brevundimonas sp. Root1423]|uniref:N(4)-(beta-N-acetylglucosaminyl)-L-asparaginase n=1 Tax=Brevundimonas sp. Root1423 TaxID=1736462 RepID=UPI0006F1DE51|nr:N(4)-(beta-N-acetylglucosaminyl)-L-asparaginase [Brevundimonas sp. Root1423]KQY84711.1 N(4)-(beta-N-acetylglucosaminyl)-L-asparaginase [Brevundimonas sp. Root1423]
MSAPSRRAVLGAAPLVAIAGSAGAQDRAPDIMVSTWNFGAAANAAGWAARQEGGSALDMVEAGGRVAEADESNTSVGLGGLPDRDGRVTLDACVMTWAGDIGAVCALEDVVHAVSVARRVMERTPHTMLVGPGASAFALDQGFETQNLLTPRAETAWREWLKTADYAPRPNSENADWRGTPGGPGNHDTIGLLAIGADQRMAGACTTSGMAFKMAGRVGDSPIIGAGLYVDDEVGGATATGVGEDVVRVAGSHSVVEAMRHGLDPTAACRSVIERLARLRGTKVVASQVALLALDKSGRSGAFALQPGFTYAVTDAAGRTRIERAGALFA